MKIFRASTRKAAGEGCRDGRIVVSSRAEEIGGLLPMNLIFRVEGYFEETRKRRAQDRSIYCARPW